jgi:hypothetical protein
MLLVTTLTVLIAGEENEQLRKFNRKLMAHFSLNQVALFRGSKTVWDGS